MSKNKKDGHGGGKAGVRSEKEMRAFIESWGLTLLKTQKHFIDHYGSRTEGLRMWRETMIRPIPSKYHRLSTAKTKYGRLRRYQTDGYIPELNLIVEMKYSESKGTTEEKVHKDLLKIMEGVYTNELDSHLLYIFFGPNSLDAFDFEMFEMNFDEARNAGNPHCQKVTVIRDDSDELERLRDYLAPKQMAAK